MAEIGRVFCYAIVTIFVISDSVLVVFFCVVRLCAYYVYSCASLRISHQALYVCRMFWWVPRGDIALLM